MRGTYTYENETLPLHFKPREMKRITNYSDLNDAKQNRSLKVLSVSDMLKIRGGDKSTTDPRGLK
jgi:hypothetical protein